MLVSVMLDKLRRTLKDQDKNSYSDAELLDYMESGINFLRRIIINLNPEYITQLVASEKLDHTLLEDGTLSDIPNRIELPADINYISGVRANGRLLKKEGLSSVPNLEVKGRPQYYCITANNVLFVFPKPQEKTTVDVYGVYSAPSLAPTDTLPFNSDLLDIVFEYVVIRAGMADSFQMSQELSVMGTLAQQIEKIVLQANQCEYGRVKPYYA